MITFVLLATLLTAIVLLLVLLPLRNRPAPAPGAAAAVNVSLYRDQLRELDEDLAAGTIDRERHAEARADLERRLLEDTDGSTVAPASPVNPRGIRGTVLALAVIVPVITVSLYLVTGTPDALMKDAVAPESAHAVTPQQVEQMISKLAARLKDTPDDAEGWLMLGRSYAALNRFKEAAPAYAKAAALIPDSAQVMVDYADVLAMSLGRRLAGEPEKLVMRALEIDPGNLKALAMAGTIEFDKKNYAVAIAHWQKLVTALPPDSEIAGSVRSSIAEARSLAGMKPESAGSSATTPSAGAGRVSGTVRIADNLKARLAPDDVVFIFARAKDGPPAPLAVLRKRAADLPVKFVLDDSMAMAPGMNLSRFSTVIVGARISKSGSAGRQPGDIEGFSPPVRTGATDIDVIIRTEVR